jgi:hypothetical protein
VTLIVLAVLATAWLGYFVLWFRERRASQPIRTDGMVDFNRPIKSAGRGRTFTGSIGQGAKSRGELFDAPRSAEQALARRRQVVAVLGAMAAASLLAIPALGVAAVAVHVLADVALLLFTFGAVRRQQVPAPSMAEVRVLYPQRSAPSEVVVTPLRRVVNG